MNQKSNIPDFFCTYSKEFPILLRKLNIILCISTIDANKVIFLRANEKNNIVQFLRNANHPMGLAQRDNFLALATRSDLQVFKTQKGLSSSFPEYPDTFDKVFLPKTTYHCGNIDLHDIAFLGDKIVGVSSTFSCVVEFSNSFSFIPKWHPAFISELQPEDRCHLNGIAIENDEIKYVTALGNTNHKDGWRKDKVSGGVLIDYRTKKILLDHLGAPHSPTISDNELFIALAATGEILKYNPESKESTVFSNLSGYIRGMQIIDDYIFVGLSKLRNTSLNVFDFPISKKQLSCGICILSKTDGKVVAELKYEKDVNEIYSIMAIKDCQSVILFNKENDEWKYAIETSVFHKWIKKES
jgi:uncharacterized protein (TIGR03032 family)